jgi:hypothetical protein
MMDYKNYSIIPNDGIIRVLQLIGDKKKSDTLSLRLISEHTSFVGSGHSIFSSSEDRVNHIIDHMSCIPSKNCNNETTKSIYTDMT